MATFIKDKESGELTLYEDVVFYLPGLTSWGKVLLVTFKSWVQKLLSACENRNGTPALEGLDGVYMLLIVGNWTTVAWEKNTLFLLSAEMQDLQYSLIAENWDEFFTNSWDIAKTLTEE